MQIISATVKVSELLCLWSRVMGTDVDDVDDVDVVVVSVSNAEVVAVVLQTWFDWAQALSLNVPIFIYIYIYSDDKHP